MKFIHDWKINIFKIIYFHPHLLSKYYYLKLEYHFKMMDDEIVIVRENMMVGPNDF